MKRLKKIEEDIVKEKTNKYAKKLIVIKVQIKKEGHRLDFETKVEMKSVMN